MKRKEIKHYFGYYMDYLTACFLCVRSFCCESSIFSFNLCALALLTFQLNLFYLTRVYMSTKSSFAPKMCHA